MLLTSFFLEYFDFLEQSNIEKEGSINDLEALIKSIL